MDGRDQRGEHVRDGLHGGYRTDAAPGPPRGTTERLGGPADRRGRGRALPG
ncbi:hypothetical protein BN6_24780 [Saccharothrix espanaensis DSM 44229]|uniref:Uncharacterized protein n=1 Tax=Saccharothrix espanaensis (strain ATCC 51144 / DSM 44229 / JCM 9112 / NBRC 15066 / NRRL 15764) TaxID=1179773 RepID=K0JWD7_SACES|nr:hypothetical protein BN6_24780 [Saccharothrix espanaensis DSM 44229]